MQEDMQVYINYNLIGVMNIAFHYMGNKKFEGYY